MNYALDSSITSAFWPGMIALIVFLTLATLVLIALIFDEARTRSYRHDDGIVPIQPSTYSNLAEPPRDMPVGTSIVHPREMPISRRRMNVIAVADAPTTILETTDPNMRIDLGSRVDSLFETAPLPVPVKPAEDITPEDIRPTSPAPLQSQYKVTLSHLLDTARRLEQPSAGGLGAHYLPTGGYPIVQPKPNFGAQQAMATQWQVAREEYTPRHGVKRDLVTV